MTTQTPTNGRQRSELRHQVRALCAEVGFYFTPVQLDIRLTYLRTLVSEYNRDHGTNVRVSKRGVHLYLVEDLNERDTITRAEYEAFKARLAEMEQVARLLVVDDVQDPAPIEAPAVKVQNSAVPVRPIYTELTPDTIEGPSEVAEMIAAAEIRPMTVATCFECGDEIPIRQGEESHGRLCDTCRGVV